MRPTKIAIVLFFSAWSVPAFSDDCRDRFNAHMTARIENPRQGVSRIISESKGGKPTEGRFTWLARDHYMSQPLKPEKGMWALRWKNTRYMSYDGKTWKRAGAVDDAAERREAVRVLTAQRDTATNLVCGEDTIDGVKHVTFEFDYASPPPSQIRTHEKDWINPKTDITTKSIMTMKGAGFEMTSTQYWKPLNGETLPKPE